MFVDGCFWHGCPIHSNPARWLRKSSMKDSSRPAKSKRTGRAFWTQKLAANVARDKFVTRALRKRGWRVVRLWEHDLAKNPERCVARIQKMIT